MTRAHTSTTIFGLVFLLEMTAVTSAQAEDAGARAPEASRLAKQAMAMHRAGLKMKDDETCRRAHQLYQQYLATYPDDDDATIRYYDAELLYSTKRYDEAATLYEQVASQAPRGRYFSEAVYAFVLATKNVVDAEADSKAARCEQAGPCAIPAGPKRLLAACERYLDLVKSGEDVAQIAYQRALIYYDAHHYEEAARAGDELITKHPEAETAPYAAVIEIDSWGALSRYDELRAVIARLKRSPLWKDEELRQEVAAFDKALAQKP